MHMQDKANGAKQFVGAIAEGNVCNGWSSCEPDTVSIFRFQLEIGIFIILLTLITYFYSVNVLFSSYFIFCQSLVRFRQQKCPSMFYRKKAWFWFE